MKRTDVIIPVYQPTEKLFTLLDRLQEQTLLPNRIFLFNTERKYFDRLIAEKEFEKKYPNVIVKHISKKEFDHGGTRKKAVQETENDYFVMMTDDAIPVDRFLLEKLLMPLINKEAAMSYARQVTDAGSGEIEKFTRRFNYPDEPILKSGEDLPRMGIKTFFASNVCAAYDREIYDSLGGFTEKTIFNEDMIYARGLIDAGYRIFYAADALVCHSHNYSGIQQFKRNFDLGVSHAQYPAVFENVKTESEGIRLVKTTSGHLLRIKKPWLILKLCWQSGCKYLGYFCGKNYRRLPAGVVKAFSMNREYWSR